MDVHVVLCVMLVASLCPARGEVLSEVTDNDLEESACPHTARLNLPSVLLVAQDDCYKPSAYFVSKMNFAYSTDDFRTIFQERCAEEPEVRTCIAGVDRDADACLAPLDRKMFLTARRFVEAGIEMTCADGSERVARLYGEELKQLDFFSQMRALACVTASGFKAEYRDEKDVSAFTLRRYEAMREAAECVGNVARRGRKSTERLRGLAEHMLAVMECVSPTTEEVVLCSSLQAQDNTTEIPGEPS